MITNNVIVAVLVKCNQNDQGSALESDSALKDPLPVLAGQDLTGAVVLALALFRARVVGLVTSRQRGEEQEEDEEPPHHFASNLAQRDTGNSLPKKFFCVSPVWSQR